MKTPLIVSLFLTLLTAPCIGQTSEELISVTQEFLQTLSGDQMQQIARPFDDTLRTKWTNLPVGLAPRPGIKYGDLSDDSKIRFHHFLTTLMSSQGYLKTTSIMHLDDVLNEVYQTVYERGMVNDSTYEMIKGLNWSQNNYYITVWGKPDAINPWGLKFEGHHISLNLSMAGSVYSITPLFFGTDPAEVQLTRHAGLRVMSKEEDYGFKLINALTDKQRTVATLSQEVPGDIITNPNGPKRIDDYYGIKASDLTAEQKELLLFIIKEYIHNLERDKAHEYLEKIRHAGIDEVYFAWIGSYERMKPHYYIINSPDFMIEYDNRGFENNGNHIHAIWREKSNDFGEDVLKTHYLEHKH